MRREGSLPTLGEGEAGPSPKGALAVSSGNQARVRRVSCELEVGAGPG